MKRIASLLLTAVLLATMLSVFAVPASAEGESQTDAPGITWELTENNTKLILGGKGAMPDFYKNGMEDRPWSDAISTITTVEIASGVTSIGKSAFFNFEKLSSVTIPYGVTKIGSYAFMGCKNLEYITLPSSVTSINSYAFEDCGALSSVTIPPNVTAIKAGTFMNCASLKSVTLPSGVTSIGRMAFSGCTRLTSVTLPSGVTSIGMMAFYSTGLLNLTLKASTPPTLERYAFPSSNAGFTINVPHGMGDTYRSENNWSTYSSMIQESNDVTVTAESAIGSVLSEGNIWIIIAVAVLAVGGVAALVIVKKKKAIHNA